MKTLTDEQLMELIRQSDKKAFEELFNRFYKPLTNFVLYRYGIRDRAIPHDIISNIFLTLWHKRETIIINCKIGAFFFVKVKLRMTDYYRNQQVQKKYLMETYKGEPFHEEADYPVRHKQMQSLIQEQVDLLPPKHKQVLELVRFQHLKREEVAEKLHVPALTVRTILNRAQKKLSKGLKQFMNNDYRVHNKKGRT